MKVEHRRSIRSHVFLKAMLRCAQGEFEVKLTNLSSLGACAEYPVPLAPDFEVEISRGDLRMAARIAWPADGKIGIEFADLLNVRAFQAQGKVSADCAPTPLHKPVERLSPRLEPRWGELLNR